MKEQLIKLVTNPRRYIPLGMKILQQHFCLLFRDTAFFMQGQMDINPRSLWHNPEFVEQTGGYFPKINKSPRIICNLDPWDVTRKDMLILLLRTVIENNISGDIAEVGVYRGMTAKLIHYYIPERRLHLFDTFEGFGGRSVVREKSLSGHSIEETHFSDTSLDGVKAYISPINDNVSFYKGYFPETIPDDLNDREFSFVHLDADLYEPTFEGLSFFYPRLSKGGFIVIHDYNTWPGARKAVDLFFADKSETVIPMPDKSGSALVLKQ